MFMIFHDEINAIDSPSLCPDFGYTLNKITSFSLYS